MNSISPDLKKLIDGNFLDQAYFQYIFALERNWQLIAEIQFLLKGLNFSLSGGINENLQKISEKIKQ